MNRSILVIGEQLFEFPVIGERSIFRWRMVIQDLLVTCDIVASEIALHFW